MDPIYALQLARRRVEIPEAGEGHYVLVQELDGAARDAYDASLFEQRRNRVVMQLEHATAKLVVLSVVNEDGSRRFGDDEIPRISKLPARVLKRIADAAKELSGISDDDLEEAAEIKK